MKKHTARRIRIAGTLLFAVYIIALAYFMFFCEGYGRNVTRETYRYNLLPFHEIQRFWYKRTELGFQTVFLNLAGNVVAFIPFGFFLPLITHGRSRFLNTVMMTFLFSTLIEFIQLLTKVGSFDVDDMILNTLGGIIGCMIFYICSAAARGGKKR